MTCIAARFTLTYFGALTLLAGLAGGAANAQGPSAPDIMKATLAQTEKTAEVSTDELRRILADKSATVFDARPHMEYATSHIPGALNVAPKAGVPMSLYVSDVNEIWPHSQRGEGSSDRALLQWSVLRQEQAPC